MELVGRISYCLQPLRRRKRRRGESPPAAPVDGTANGGGGGDDEVPLIGFLFHEQRADGHDDDHTASAAGTYLLAAPQSLLRDVCGAAHRGDRVRLRRYARVPVAGHPRIRTMLELHAGGLVVERRAGVGDAGAENSQEPALTLPQLRRLEAVDRLTGYRTPTYTFRATVWAVSSIFTFDPTDPCSLMELREDPAAVGVGTGGTTTCACVAVLRRDSLGLHAALRPGQTVTLRAVRRQAWAIPAALRRKGFPRLAERVPPRVFVVDGPNQLAWIEGDTPDAGPDEDGPSARDEDALAGTFLTGRVASVHMTVSDAGARGVRCIALDRPDGDRCLLFLTYLPLPSDLQQALRPGAEVAAYHLHRLGRDYYGACLQSSLVVREMASEASSTVTGADDGDSARSLRHLQPCAFLPVGRTYAEWVCRHELEEFLRPLQEWFNLEEVPKEAWVARLLGPDVMKTYPRIAYAEFFDHEFSEGHGTTRAGEETVSDDGESTDDVNAECGCHLSGYDRLHQALPCILSLQFVRLQATELVRACLDAFLCRTISDGCQTGWTGSSVLFPNDFRGYSAGGKGSQLYTGGILEPCASPIGSHVQFGIISDKHTALPLTIRSCCRQIHGEPFLALIRIACVRVSFVYIGPDVPGNTIDSNRAIKGQENCILPPLFLSRSTFGSSAIVCHSNHIFMVSLRMESDDLLTLDSTAQQQQSTPAHEDVVPVSIRDCLDPSVAKCPEGFVEGCLLRKFLRPQRVKNGVYNGMMIVLSHVVRSGAGTAATETETSAMQSIEIKPTVKVSASIQNCLQQKLSTVLGVCATEDQLSVAAAWWVLADNMRTCALIDGGLEEFLETAAPMVTLGQFPVSSLVTDEKRGYVRVRCSLDDLAVYSSMLHPASVRPGLHFIGGKRFFPGMLNRRAPRKALDSTGSGRKGHGELLCSPVDHAVPCSTLGQICLEICQAMRLRTGASLAPSLVRRIRNASTLGILFCSATAECTKCFSALRDVPGQSRPRDGSDGLRSSVPLAGAAPPSSWHRPLGRAAAAAAAAPPPPPLECPNRCSPAWAGVKWECSCLLDDGTGQARLLAEREAALALLGLDGAAARRIERGAAREARGIVVSRGMPPRAYLPGAVRAARGLARDAWRSRNDGTHGRRPPPTPLTEEDVLQYLTPVAAAEYLLQRHCRRSREPRRGMVYYVRCKPLSDAVHLNQTSVEVHAPGLRDGDAHRRDAATYSLPPLKLSLVDCGVEDAPAGAGYEEDGPSRVPTGSED